MRSGSLREFVCGSTLSRPRLARAKGLPSFRISELEIVIVLSWLRRVGDITLSRIGAAGTSCAGSSDKNVRIHEGVFFTKTMVTWP